jgi:hypothetical protein
VRLIAGLEPLVWRPRASAMPVVQPVANAN